MEPNSVRNANQSWGYIPITLSPLLRPEIQAQVAAETDNRHSRHHHHRRTGSSGLFGFGEAPRFAPEQESASRQPSQDEQQPSESQTKEPKTSDYILQDIDRRHVFKCGGAFNSFHLYQPCRCFEAGVPQGPPRVPGDMIDPCRLDQSAMHVGRACECVGPEPAPPALDGEASPKNSICKRGSAKNVPSEKQQSSSKKEPSEEARKPRVDLNAPSKVFEGKTVGQAGDIMANNFYNSLLGIKDGEERPVKKKKPVKEEKEEDGKVKKGLFRPFLGLFSRKKDKKTENDGGAPAPGQADGDGDGGIDGAGGVSAGVGH